MYLKCKFLRGGMFVLQKDPFLKKKKHNKLFSHRILLNNQHSNILKVGFNFKI